MIKAVNMEKYRFGKLGNKGYVGFGMLDTKTDTFVSLDGFNPYVLRKKRIIQLCIDECQPETMKRVAHA